MTLSHCDPTVQHQKGDCLICDFYQKLYEASHKFPHCDAYIVHSPESCEFCDDYASELQKWREDNNVNFTGENDPNKLTCPATKRRDINKIHAWYGNFPTPRSCKKCGKAAVYINLALACPVHGPV